MITNLYLGPFPRPELLDTVKDSNEAYNKLAAYVRDRSVSSIDEVQAMLPDLLAQVDDLDDDKATPLYRSAMRRLVLRFEQEGQVYNTQVDDLAGVDLYEDTGAVSILIATGKLLLTVNAKYHTCPLTFPLDPIQEKFANFHIGVVGLVPKAEDVMDAEQIPVYVVIPVRVPDDHPLVRWMPPGALDSDRLDPGAEREHPPLEMIIPRGHRLRTTVTDFDLRTRLYFNMGELKALYGTTSNNLYVKASSGEIETVKDGGRRKIPRAEFTRHALKLFGGRGAQMEAMRECSRMLEAVAEKFRAAIGEH